MRKSMLAVLSPLSLGAVVFRPGRAGAAEQDVSGHARQRRRVPEDRTLQGASTTSITSGRATSPSGC